MLKKTVFILFLLCQAYAKCPPREKAIDCFYEVADTNHDGFISRHELHKAISSRLPWWKNYAFNLFGGLDRIIKDCDLNGDKKLTKEESLQMTKTCMNSCYKKRNTYELFKCK